VIEALADRGVRAVAFDMPGCGADPTPRNQANLAMQVDRVVDHIDATPDGEIRLVGHSIGGWVLAPAAAARPDRVKELAFVGGAVLGRSERGIDITPTHRQAGYYALAASSPDNSLMVSFEDAHARFFNHLDERAARRAYARLTPQPFQPYLDAALVGIEDVSVARRYIAMADDRTYPAAVTELFAAKADVAREVIPADHCVMLSAPDLLAATLG